ncbi:MAG: hypothetical protein U1E65_03245 [Myxococcota bacterium]
MSCSLRHVFSLLPVSALLLVTACGGTAGEEGLGASEAAVTGVPLFPNYLVYSIAGGPIRVRNLTALSEVSLPVSGRFPVMSPDRLKIAYVSSAGRVTVCDADGSNVHSVSGTGFTAPAWSPDSRLLAYASEGQAGYGANIFLRPADLSTAQRQLTSNPGGWYFSPKFLSNSQLVFQRGFNGAANFPIVSASASMQSTFVTMGGMSGTTAARLEPSPSAVEIVYERESGSCGYASIVVAALDFDNNGIPTASGHHEIYCAGSLSRDSHQPSWGWYGKIAFTRDNPIGGSDAETIGSSGSNPPLLQFSTTAQLDLTIR